MGVLLTTSVAAPTTIHRYEDGVGWEAITAPFVGIDNTQPSCGWTGTNFVLAFPGIGSGRVPAADLIFTSPDGRVWTRRTAPTGAWATVRCNGATCIALPWGAPSATTQSILVSTDHGVTWTLRTVILPEPGTVTYNVIWTGVEWLILPDSISTPTRSAVMTSPDGATWTARTTSSTVNRVLTVSRGSGSRIVYWSNAGVRYWAPTSDVATLTATAETTSSGQVGDRYLQAWSETLGVGLMAGPTLSSHRYTDGNALVSLGLDTSLGTWGGVWDGARFLLARTNPGDILVSADAITVTTLVAKPAGATYILAATNALTLGPGGSATLPALVNVAAGQNALPAAPALFWHQFRRTYEAP